MCLSLPAPSKKKKKKRRSSYSEPDIILARRPSRNGHSSFDDRPVTLPGPKKFTGEDILRSLDYMSFSVRTQLEKRGHEPPQCAMYAPHDWIQTVHTFKNERVFEHSKPLLGNTDGPIGREFQNMLWEAQRYARERCKGEERPPVRWWPDRDSVGKRPEVQELERRRVPRVLQLAQAHGRRDLKEVYPGRDLHEDHHGIVIFAPRHRHW